MTEQILEDHKLLAQLEFESAVIEYHEMALVDFEAQLEDYQQWFTSTH